MYGSLQLVRTYIRTRFCADVTPRIGVMAWVVTILLMIGLCVSLYWVWEWSVVLRFLLSALIYDMSIFDWVITIVIGIIWVYMMSQYLTQGQDRP